MLAAVLKDFDHLVLEEVPIPEPNLGEVVDGSKPGRESAEEITFFKSVGLAVQDAASAARVFDLAKAAGVGVEIEI